MERNGNNVDLHVPKDILGQLSTKKIGKKGLLNFRMPTIVDSMDEKSVERSSAFKAGILPNDKIVKLDSTPVEYWNEISSYTDKLKDSAVVAVTVLRSGSEKTFNVKLDANHKLGIAPVGISKLPCNITCYLTVSRRIGLYHRLLEPPSISIALATYSLAG